MQYDVITSTSLSAFDPTILMGQRECLEQAEHLYKFTHSDRSRVMLSFVMGDGGSDANQCCIGAGEENLRANRTVAFTKPRVSNPGAFCLERDRWDGRQCAGGREMNPLKYPPKHTETHVDEQHLPSYIAAAAAVLAAWRHRVVHTIWAGSAACVV